MAGIKIENIVATALIAEQLDLEKVKKCLKGGEFSPARFPGLIYHTLHPKSAVLLFRSGKIVCTGTKTLKEVSKVINGIVRTLKKRNSGISGAVAKPEIQVQNIVASADLGVAARSRIMELFPLRRREEILTQLIGTAAV